MRLCFVQTRAAALTHLAEAIPGMGEVYAAGRNTDAGPGADPTTTRLSPYLRRRLLLEQEVVEAALAAHGPHAAGRFVDEVFWRSYFKGHLETHPSVWTRYIAELADEQARLAGKRRLATRLRKRRVRQYGHRGFRRLGA